MPFDAPLAAMLRNVSPLEPMAVLCYVQGRAAGGGQRVGAAGDRERATSGGDEAGVCAGRDRHAGEAERRAAIAAGQVAPVPPLVARPVKFSVPAMSESSTAVLLPLDTEVYSTHPTNRASRVGHPRRGASRERQGLDHGFVFSVMVSAP